LAGNAVANGTSWCGRLRCDHKRSRQHLWPVGPGFAEVRAIADVVIWDGDPLELMSSPDAVYIAGVSTPMESRQTKLRDRYLNLDEDKPQAYERQ